MPEPQLIAIDANALPWEERFNEKLGKKVRNASIRKVPYVLVIGDREAEAGQVAVRLRDGTDLGPRSVAEVVLALR